MNAADESRKYWASLLAGNTGLNALGLAGWLGAAASALDGEPPDGGDATANASTATAPGVMDAFNWAALMTPFLTACTEAMEAAERSVSGWALPQVENPLARLVGHPAAVVGSDDTAERHSAKAGLALVDLMQAAIAHQALQSRGWMKALQVFFAEFHQTGGRTVTLSSLDDVLTHWSTVGEAALQEHSRSEPFLQSQANVLRKAMGYRIAQRHFVESTARANDLPTLSDLDEAFAAIHYLRRELREVRRVVVAPAFTVDAAARPAASKPSKASSVHSRTKSKAGARRARTNA